MRLVLAEGPVFLSIQSIVNNIYKLVIYAQTWVSEIMHLTALATCLWHKYTSCMHMCCIAITLFQLLLKSAQMRNVDVLTSLLFGLLPSALVSLLSGLPMPGCVRLPVSVNFATLCGLNRLLTGLPSGLGVVDYITCEIQWYIIRSLAAVTAATHAAPANDMHVDISSHRSSNMQVHSQTHWTETHWLKRN